MVICKEVEITDHPATIVNLDPKLLSQKTNNASVVQ